MSRFRTEQKKILGMGQKGTIRYELIASDKALALFSVQERNAIVREAMRKAGVRWVALHYPKRFTDYAYSLGYKVSFAYKKLKNKLFVNPTPLYGVPVKGQFVHLIDQKPSVTATATNTKAEAKIAMPTGHPIAQVVTRVLKTVPAAEVADIALEVGRTIRDVINNSERGDARGRTLTAPMRARLGIKPRKTYGSNRSGRGIDTRGAA